MRLSDLKTGEKGVVVKVLGHGGFRKRIVEMGFIKGKTVEVLLNAPLRDPIKYRIMGYEISLRRQEAARIEVISEQEAALIKEEDYKLQTFTEHVELNDDYMKKVALGKRRQINVALVGNPNCGKTSLFNLASGAHEHVGNYSGVTVDAKEGTFNFEGYEFKIVDLPGTYSLTAYTPEEVYVRNHIIEETPDIIINVVDSSNLERNLYLTTQLIDMNVRMVVALNMYDELSSSGNTLDHYLLSKLFGVPMVPTVCRVGKGIENLFHVVINLYEGADFLDKDGHMNPEVKKDIMEWHNSLDDTSKHGEHFEDFTQDTMEGAHHVYRHIHINHGLELEDAIDAVKKEISKNTDIRDKYSTRFLAIKLLECDKEYEKRIQKLANVNDILSVRDACEKRLSSTLGEDGESAIMHAKYAFIAGALKSTYVDNHIERGGPTKYIDSIVTHRIWGFPIFFLLLFIMFQATFILGEYPMGWIESLVGWISDLVSQWMPEGALKDMVIDGIIAGVGGVIVFLPNILILYFFISLMEDSGYMARAAFIMDKIMHKMGLHGKSFIPLIMGFGCNVPAILASRTIENRKARLITILVNPLMSCSARLPIFLLLIGAFFPKHGSLMLFSLYLIGILLAVIIAKLLSKFMSKADDTPFVMELPPYRLPTSRAILRHTWEKGSQYLRKMGGIIMLASILIWFLGYFPKAQPGDTMAQQQEKSYIGQIGQAIEPVIEPLGFDWKMGVGLISGLGAKELVVSTLGVLYANDPDADATSIAERLPITPLVAFCYMLFVLIYFPCVATIIAIKQEAGGWKWGIFAAVYTTGLAWLISWIVYHIGLWIL